MRGTIIIIFISIFCGLKANAMPDTVYFNEDWKIASNSNYTYFRVLKDDGDRLLITDHYSNGMIQMTGAVANTQENLLLAKSLRKLEGHEVGEFNWYFKNGIRYQSIDYNPSLEGLDSLLLSDVNTDSLRYEKTYYMNGSVKEEGLIIAKDTPHGKRIRYHKEGPVKSETTYDRGVIIRTKYTYRDSGVMISSTEYDNGKKHGKEKYFDHLGRLKVTRVYDHGNMKKEQKRYLSITRVR